MQQKVVLKLADIQEDMNSKKKSIKLVSSIPGIESISVNMKEKNLTVVGEMDPIAIVKKLRKNYYTEIVSVGPAKEPEKPKEEPKKEEPKPTVVQVPYNSYYNYAYTEPVPVLYSKYNNYNNGYYRSVEEDPNACVIC